MFKKFFFSRYQKKINKLKPEVNINLNYEIPFPSGSTIVNYSRLVSEINGLEDKIKDKPNEFFTERTKQLKSIVGDKIQGVKDKDKKKKVIEDALEELLPEAFALVRESARRTVKMRHFDVQLLGGIVLHKSGIAEMATGEGKTLVATLPVYLNALTGQGVHVVTVNDYLAKRDREWMGPVYEFLGLSVGVIQQGMVPSQRKQAYGCDVTYGTNNEFGFDYLRDNMVLNFEDMVQREHSYAIIDEVDSILIDEARTPLIISGPTEESKEKYYTARKIALSLSGKRILEKEEVQAKHEGVDLGKGYDYLADEKTQAVTLTEQGLDKCEEVLGVKDLYEDIHSEWPHHIRQALRAKEFFRRDKDYVLKNNQVIIVDEFTGRLMPGRRWSDGLHQAVEAREGLKIQDESQTLATITLQNYFKMYDKLAGMTGTAFTEAGEFKHIYDLEVEVIPTNKPLDRKNHSDQIYKTEEGKFEAVVKEIEELNEKGRPILVGTSSIDNSEKLSGMLKKKGIIHQVLNAKYHEREAYIVSQAGRLKQVTIATNMAGRGTDIVLGGNPEYLAKNVLNQEDIEPDTEEYEQRYKELVVKYEDNFVKEHKQVVKAGGLHVIGTGRHEARRIDNQLRGRAGRQGDPGSSRFYISLQDDLMRLFGSERITGIMENFGLPEDQPIEHPMINRSISVAQKRVEGHNFEIRKQLLDLDNVMNQQREVIYTRRREILEGKNLRQEVLEMCTDSIRASLEYLFSKEIVDLESEKDRFLKDVNFRFGIEVDKPVITDKSLDESEQIIFEKIKAVYEDKEKRAGAERMRFLEKITFLQIIDSRWKEHLLVLDNLKEGINLRSYGQRNPIEEYKRESYEEFLNMMDSIREGILDIIFKAEAREESKVKGVFSELPRQFSHSDYSSFDKQQQGKKPSSEKQVKYSGKKVGRNDPCPCGSGKKYKKCCGR